MFRVLLIWFKVTVLRIEIPFTPKIGLNCLLKKKNVLTIKVLTLNSASNLSSCFALYACLGFRSNPGFRDLRPTVFGAVRNNVL